MPCIRPLYLFILLSISGLHCNSEQLGNAVTSIVPGSYLLRDIPGEATFVVPKEHILLPSKILGYNCRNGGLDSMAYFNIRNSFIAKISDGS